MPQHQVVDTLPAATATAAEAAHSSFCEAYVPVQAELQNPISVYYAARAI